MTVSQFGEEALIAQLIAKFDPPKTSVEFGAYDGITNSNTYKLWKDQGFRSVLIEADDAMFAQLRQNAGPNCLLAKEFVTLDNPLVAILARLGFDGDIGVLSIDIDSNDLDVFEAVDHDRTHIVVIEYNQQLPHWSDYRDPEGIVFLRHSAKAVMQSALERGYGVVRCIGTNMVLMNGRKATLPDEYYKPDLEAMFDFAEQKRACGGDARIIGCKFTTNAKVFAVKPTPMLRLKAAIRKANFALNYAARGRQIPSDKIHPACAERVRAAGLYL